MVLIGIAFFSNPAQAQETIPVVIHKRANVEEAQVDDTIAYSITVANTGRVDAALVASDVLPDDIVYLADSVKTTAGQAFYNGDTRTIQWNGTLKGGEQATVQFTTKVLPVLDATKCAAAIVNQAVVAAVDPTTTPLETAPGVAQVKRICPDLGDAPDSTNHAGAAMTAYPNPVTARYPTVFDPATGTPQGPRHRFARADAWLGARVSGERDADLMPDEDLAPNLQPSADTADRDRYDDGVTKWPTLANCVQTDMAVDVNVVGGLRTRYINAWIDWNRDGDWEDSFDCPNGKVSEWVVQNFVTNLNNGTSNVPLPAFLAWDTPNIPERDRWLRVSIAEEPAPRNPTTEQADGRGPPTGYRFGETEDYQVRFEAPVEPKLEMVKQADVSVVNPGGVIEYSITVINSGSGPSTGVIVNDPIPGGTSYVAGSATATAGTVTYNGGLTRIDWTGNIPAGGSVTIKFKVTVSREIACDAVIRNRAELLDAAGTLLQDATAFV
ncbi:MAG: DUF11 domain-containing protein, partial [Caldilineaceae bacterium]|nr:DUF11 domain-containing protein [Caldilineaceae bacterium]